MRYKAKNYVIDPLVSFFAGTEGNTNHVFNHKGRCEMKRAPRARKYAPVATVFPGVHCFSRRDGRLGVAPIFHQISSMGAATNNRRELLQVRIRIG